MPKQLHDLVTAGAAEGNALVTLELGLKTRSIGKKTMPKPQFLVVEDNEVDVRYLRHVLSKAGITAISHARDGEQAIAQLRTLTEGLSSEVIGSQIVMLLDLNLPIMNGFDVLKFVQSNPSLSRMKIFVVTSNDDEHSRERAVNWGATGYIVKPLSLAQIANILETITRPARQAKPVTSDASESARIPSTRPH